MSLLHLAPHYPKEVVFTTSEEALTARAAVEAEVGPRHYLTHFMQLLSEVVIAAPEQEKPVIPLVGNEAAIVTSSLARLSHNFNDGHALAAKQTLIDHGLEVDPLSKPALQIRKTAGTYWNPDNARIAAIDIFAERAQNNGLDLELALTGYGVGSSVTRTELIPDLVIPPRPEELQRIADTPTGAVDINELTSV